MENIILIKGGDLTPEQVKMLPFNGMDNPGFVKNHSFYFEDGKPCQKQGYYYPVCHSLSHLPSNDVTEYDTINPTINFAYFMANFPSNFISKVWKDNKGLAAHFTEKFEMLVSKENAGFVTYNVFMNWFFQLGDNHKEELIDWVTKNYRYK